MEPKAVRLAMIKKVKMAEGLMTIRFGTARQIVMMVDDLQSIEANITWVMEAVAEKNNTGTTEDIIMTSGAKAVDIAGDLCYTMAPKNPEI
mmetsp:Transcript_14744/g.42464  ORF Transcript_14744/g.42464 Transcript_14744/m.42464 type:complete len:91 (+) Transcript_14744:1668-1940(+)